MKLHFALLGTLLSVGLTSAVTLRPSTIVYGVIAGAKDVIPTATVAIRVRVGSVIQPAIGTNTFIARGDGSSVNINLVLGVDTDGDGLPDDWERLVILNSGGRVSSLSEVGPGHDLDGDGVPDDQEFWLGTFAFLPDDLLRIEALTRHPNSRMSFTFRPIEGASYTVEYSPTLDSPVWTLCPVSLTENGSLVSGSVTGGTQDITLFLEATEPSRFWRLRQQ
jgi:hypothetical protein